MAAVAHLDVDMRLYFSLSQVPDFTDLPKERLRELEKSVRWTHFRHWQFWIAFVGGLGLPYVLRRLLLADFGFIGDMIWLGMYGVGIMAIVAVMTMLHARRLRYLLERKRDA
jgi:hypothetical protein